MQRSAERGASLGGARGVLLAVAAALALGACGDRERDDAGQAGGYAGGYAPAGPPPQIGYAEVQELLRGLGKPARSSPHQDFWTRPWAEFVAYEFEDHDTGNRMKVLVPWDGSASNLVKALRDGQGIAATRPDGSATSVDLARMPKNGPYLSEQDIAKIERWIDAGAPEIAGTPSSLPRPGD